MISRNVLRGLLAGLLVTLKIETTLAQEKPEAEVLRVPEVVVSATRLPDLLLDLKRVPAQVRGTTEEELEVAGGSVGHQRYRGSVGGPVGAFDYYLGFTQYLEEGFRDESDADVRRLFAKVGRRIGADTDIAVSYLFVDDRLEQAGSIREDLLAQDRTQNVTPGDFVAHTLHAGTLNVRQQRAGGLPAAR